MLKNALTIARNNVKLYFRKPAAVVGGMAAPVVVLLIFGVIYSNMGGDTQDIEIELLYVDQENSETSRTFLENLKKESVFKIYTTDPRIPETETPLTKEDVKDMILKGKARLGLVYNRSERDPNWPVVERPVLTLYYDPGSNLEREITAGLVQKNAFMGFGNEMPKESVDLMLETLDVQDTPVGKSISGFMNNVFEMWQNQDEGDGGDGATNMMGELVEIRQEEIVHEEVKRGDPAMANMVSGVITMFLLFSVSYAAGSLLEEQQEGTIRRLLLAPITVDSIILGKSMSIFLTSSINVFIMLLLAALVFHVNVLGNFIPVVIISVATIAACTSFGMIFASLAKNYEQVVSMTTIVVLSMSAIGGSMFPRVFMPEWMQNLGLFTVNGWAIDGFLDALYYYNGPGSMLGFGEAHSFMDVVYNSEALVLILFSVICSVIAGRIFKRRLTGAK